MTSELLPPSAPPVPFEPGRFTAVVHALASWSEVKDHLFNDPAFDQGKCSTSRTFTFSNGNHQVTPHPVQQDP
jgi:hypothetical protein